MLRMRISSSRACSVHASAPGAYAQHDLKALFKFEIFTLYAEHTRKELVRMLSIRISSSARISRIFAKTSPKQSFLVKENEHFGLAFAKTGSINLGTGDFIRLSIRVRNFAALNEPLLNKIFVF